MHGRFCLRELSQDFSWYVEKSHNLRVRLPLLKAVVMAVICVYTASWVTMRMRALKSGQRGDLNAKKSNDKVISKNCGHWFIGMGLKTKLACDTSSHASRISQIPAVFVKSRCASLARIRKLITTGNHLDAKGTRSS